MNPDPNRLTSGEILSLVKAFTAKIGDFAAREGKINYAENLRESNLRQSVAEARARVETELAEQREAIETRAEAAKANIEPLARRREQRIEKAKLNDRRRVLEEIQQKEGAQRFQLQKQMIEAAKARDAGIGEAQRELEAQKAPFAGLEEPVENIKLSAPKALRGFPAQGKKLEQSFSVSAETAYSGGFEKICERTIKTWSRLRKSPFLPFYAAIPFWLQMIVILLLGAAAWFILPGQIEGLDAKWIGIGTLGLAAVAGLCYLAALNVIGSSVQNLAKCFRHYNREKAELYGRFEEHFEARKAAFLGEFQQVEASFRQGLDHTGADAGARRLAAPEQVDLKARRVTERLGQWKSRRLEAIEKSRQSQIAALESSLQQALSAAGGAAGPAQDFPAQRASLAAQWQRDVPAAAAEMSAAEKSFDPEGIWFRQTPDNWSPPADFPEEVFFGSLAYRLADSGARLPVSPEMPFSHAREYEFPLRLLFPARGSLLIETAGTGPREQAIAALNQVVTGLLVNAPPGRLSFSLFDPLGLGESFAGLMHLSDYEEHLVNKRVRTQSQQIEIRLGELCEHMEKVIQMYLRNEYATISEYNRAAGTTAEKYHFVVIADFPRQFSEESARRLLSIAQSGARCGVFMLIHYDRRTPLPPGFPIDDIKKSCTCLKPSGDGFVLGDEAVPGTTLHLFAPPPGDLFARWIHRIGEANRDSNQIQVPFSTISPRDDQFWSLETAEELRVPIGRTGATKLQYLAIGKGTCQHALIAGKTGSGKSTLFHVMITNMAQWFDPGQVEFYLIDFKKGVEFKAYATHHLPHARVIAIESDREFGLSVLQKLDEELKERGEKFRARGAQDIAGYRRAGGEGPIPRTLLLIDEFQEFFVEDDQISQQAAVLLDRIVRQGRAFGIHAILGSQTLGGAFTLARTTLGQMVIRIALMCNEADAYLIMDDSNPAPRLLTRPGEGIYNDQAGNAQANSPFQVVWLDDEDKNQRLDRIASAATARGMDRLPRVIFEGNAPARIEEDSYVMDFLSRGGGDGQPRWFLGAPNSIKAPTAAIFPRQSGANLMIVGQRDDVVEGLVDIGLRLLAAQLGPKGRFILIDSQVSDPNARSWLKDAVACLASGVICPDAHEMGTVINSLAEEMKAVAEGSGPASGLTTFLIILGLQKYKKLRYEEDFSFSLDAAAEVKPSNSLNQLITEGPAHGIHVVVSLDTYNNINRSMSRKAVAEFETKILFQMSAADSASLIDSGKASNLGLNRAIYHNESAGVTEVFRPYTRPGDGFLKGGG